MEQLQTPLFHEDIYEAYKTAVMALGGSKKVAGWLFPDKPVDKASGLLNQCLNRERSEKLDPEQLQLIKREARKIGCHVIREFEDTDEGYKSTPIEPEDEIGELQRQYISAVKLLAQITEKQSSMT